MAIDNASFDELLKKHKGLLIYQCKRYKRDGIEFEDLYQEALISLWDSAEKFDAGRSSSFGKYLAYKISSRLQAFVCFNELPVYLGRNQHWYGELILRMRRLLSPYSCTLEEVEEIIAFPGEHPLELIVQDSVRKTIGDIKGYFHKKTSSSSKYADLIRKGTVAAGLRFHSLNSSMLFDGDDSDNQRANIDPNSDDSLGRIEIKDLRKLIVEKFSAKHWLVIFLYAQGYSMPEIANKLHELGFPLYTRQNILYMVKKVQTHLKGPHGPYGGETPTSL